MTLMSILAHAPAIVLAMTMDLLLGDPVWAYHPVRLIGRIAGFLEPLFRRLSDLQKLNGALFNLAIVIGSGLSCWGLIALSATLDSNLAFLFESVVMYFCLALGSLASEGTRAVAALARGDAEEARQLVQGLVSRDLSQEDERGIIRALIESLTENISDGIVAPLFFAMIGGAPLMLAYKAINTLDSMVGYRNDRYRDFGWFSARLDDVVNFIPARLTGMFMVMSAFLLGRHPIKAIRVWWRDAQRGPSPNGGIPIVVFAGALDISLGGDCRAADGTIVEVPTVGGRRTELGIGDVRWAIIFCYHSSLLFLAAYLSLVLFFV